MHPSAAELRAARLGSQGLVRADAVTPEAVVRGLLAVQAQDPRGARLAVRSRSTGLTGRSIDRALDEGRLVVGWLVRGTLHLVAAEDYWWLHALTAPRHVTGNVRRLVQEGVSEAQAVRGVELIAEAVGSRGPLVRSQLQGLLDDAGVPTAGQALVHILFAASIAGYLVRGPMVDGEQAFVDPRSWIGPCAEEDERELWARLARRYLLRHGPADERDLVKWAGITLGAARAGFAAISEETAPWGDGLRRLVDHEPGTELPSPRLLGSFDPILHGWSSRAEFVGEHVGVVTTNGVFRPTALVGGRTTATWTADAKGLRLRLLEPAQPSDLRALERDAVAVQRFLGLAELGIVDVEAP